MDFVLALLHVKTLEQFFKILLQYMNTLHIIEILKYFLFIFKILQLLTNL